jgi:hypothetical protein
MVNVLFYCGIGVLVLNVAIAPFKGQVKPEVIALPFMFFAAAATGHFLGM